MSIFFVIVIFAGLTVKKTIELFAYIYPNKDAASAVTGGINPVTIFLQFENIYKKEYALVAAAATLYAPKNGVALIIDVPEYV